MRAKASTPAPPCTPRVNLLRAHGSPTCYQYNKGCRCCSCVSAKASYDRAYRERNHARCRDRERRYYLAHRDDRLAYSRAWASRNPEKHREYEAMYAQRHAAEIAGRKRAYAGARKDDLQEYLRAWRQTHREQTANSAREYRERHRLERSEYMRGWHRRNPGARRAYRHNREARKRDLPGTHSAADVRAQYERQSGRCYYCQKVVVSGYHVDHVIPLSKGGSNGPENIVIACADCNLRKNAAHPMDWAGILF